MLHKLRVLTAHIPGAERVLRATALLAEGFAGEAITLRASALTYLTLFALVPALAVLFTVVEAASGTKQIHDSIQGFINEQLGVGAGTAVANTLSDFVAKAHVSTIGSIGFAALLVSVISLLWNIESAFNHIFGVRRPRKVLERLLKYWTFLTLGPIFLAASVATAWQIGALSGKHGQHQQHSEILHALAAVSSIAITYVGLAILYKVMPNARVRLRSAFVSALVAGTAWELAKLAFSTLSARMVQVHKIYGSLAALPIILTWIYISWVIALVGCRFCYALDASRTADPDPSLRAAAARETFTARVVLELSRLHKRKGAPVRVRELSHELSAHARPIREALRALIGAGLVVEAKQGGFLPSRDPSQITLAQARAAARATLHQPLHHLDPLGQLVAAAWQQADEQASATLGESVAQLLARAEAEGRPPSHAETPAPSLPLAERVRP